MSSIDTPSCRHAVNHSIAAPPDDLRVALARAVAATKEVSGTIRVVDRSLALVDGALGAIAACKCIDATTATFHAGSLTLQGADKAELPVELIEAKLTRAASEKKLATTEGVHALSAFEGRQAEARNIAIIADILKTTTVSLFPKLYDAVASAGRLQASIAGCMDCTTLSTRKACEPVPIEMPLLCKRSQAAPVMAIAALNWRQAMLLWQEYHTDLISDPDANATNALGWADNSDMLVAVKPLSGDLVRSF